MSEFCCVVSAVEGVMGSCDALGLCNKERYISDRYTCPTVFLSDKLLGKESLGNAAPFLTR